MIVRYLLEGVFFHMNIQYFKNYSPALGRDMECKLYGQGGQPILFIPCQDGRFFDFENFQMTNVNIQQLQ